MTSSDEERIANTSDAAHGVLGTGERKRFLKNVSWTTLATVLRVIIAGGMLGILSHIVGPATMGLFGIGFAAASLGYTISQSGAAQGIIALPVLETKHIAAAQLLSILLSVSIALVLVLASSFVERFYHYDGLDRAFLIGGLFVPAMNMAAVDFALTQRELKFSQLAFVQTGAVTLSALSSLMLALTGHGLVALYALQGLVGFYSFFLFRLFRRSPGFGRTSRRHLLDVWRIGMHLSLGSLTAVVWLNTPQLILARLISVEQLGIYVFCSRVIQIIASQLSTMVNNVVYPTFARFQSKPVQLGKAFLETVRFTYFCLMVPLVMLAAAPSAFLQFFGGVQWQSGAAILFYLVLMQMVIALGSNVFPTFLALGKASVPWRWNVFITIVQGTTILVTAQFGLVVVARGLAVSACVMPLAVWLLSRATGFQFLDYWRNMAFIIGAALPAVILGRFLERILEGQPMAGVFVLSAISSVAVYICVVVAFEKGLRVWLVEAARTAINRLQTRSSKLDI